MTPKKIFKTFKSDLAPVGFYFDIFATEIFKIPIMPIPMRIDKLVKGESTFFILPDITKINRLIDKLALVLNMKSFLLTGLKNLINFAKKKFQEKTLLNLNKEIITRWFENSLALKAEIPSLTKDFTFLISKFLKSYAYCENKCIDYKNEEYHLEHIKYCENVISYFKRRIEGNELQIIHKESKLTVKLYKEKNNQYYPEIVSIDVNDLKNDKKRFMNFVPYLIYDDIIDVFSYNKKLLMENSQNTIDLKIWNNNSIINKRSNIKKDKFGKILKNFELKRFDLEILL